MLDTTTPLSVPLVNRHREIEIATQLLTNKFDQRRVLLLTGAPGIGKSFLISEIQRLALELGIHQAKMDFDWRKQSLVFSPHEGQDDRARLVQYLISQLLESPNYHLDPSQELITNPSKSADFLLSTVQKFERHHERAQFAIFLDSLEDCPPETWLWFQKEVISPLLLNTNGVAILGRQTDFNRGIRDSLIAPVDISLIRIHLGVFSPAETDQQIRLNDISPALTGSELNKYTNGVPGINSVALQFLSTESKKDQILETTTNVIFSFGARKGNNLSVQLRDQIAIVSVLRVFNESLLKQLRYELWPDKLDKPITEKDISDLIRALKATGLVEIYGGNRDGYEVLPEFRSILSTYFRKTQPERYFRILRVATLWVRERVKPNNLFTVADSIYYLNELWNYTAENPDYISRLTVDLQPEPSKEARIRQELEVALAQAHRSGQYKPVVSEINRTLKRVEFSHSMPAASRLLTNHIIFSA